MRPFMKMKYLKIFPLISFILLVSTLSFAQSESKISVKLDSVNLQMGRITTLHLQVTHPKGIKGNIPLLSRFRDDGIIPICGDSIELRAPSKIDSVNSANSITINYDIPLQAFDSGYYKLPEFVFVNGKDTLKSNSLALKVYPVQANAEDKIYDYASVADPENPSIFDSVPDWLLNFWWLWISIALLIIVFLYAIRKYRNQGYIIPKKPQPSPYEVAISSLNKLKAKKLWEQGLEKDYFTELTEILRIYLEKRFGINAMEMTSRQILSSLRDNNEIADKREYFRQILNMADFVKFAKVRPLPDDNIKAFDNALKFVEETKPVEVTDPFDDSARDLHNAHKSNGNKKKGGKK